MDDYLTYVFIIVSFIFGFIVGWISCYRANGVDQEEYEEYYVYTDPETGEDVEIKKTVHMVIEQDAGWLYGYNAETSEFLGQGKDGDELDYNIRKRFPNVFFTIDEENLKELVGLEKGYDPI